MRLAADTIGSGCRRGDGVGVSGARRRSCALAAVAVAGVLTVWALRTDVLAHANEQNPRAEAGRTATEPPSKTPSTAPAETAAGEAGPAGQPRRGLDRIPADVIYLPDENGNLVAVPVDASVPKFLEWLRQSRQAVADPFPAAVVSAVAIDGAADDQRATLKVTFSIDVNRSGAVLVPLAMPEAVPISSAHRGPGRSAAAVGNRERGLGWWLEGVGRHEIELQVATPVRKTSMWRRLALTLPTSPVSSLVLRLPSSTANVKPSEETLIVSRTLEDGRVQVETSGFGARLELSWQSAAVAAPAPSQGLDANTTILVRGAADTLFIDATQYVRAVQGTFRDFTVRLPVRAQLLQVDGPDIAETRADPDHPGRVTVLLLEPKTGPVAVRWQLRVPLEERRTVLEGFSVESAKRQTGEIGLIPPDGAQWLVAESKDPHLLRINAGELRAAQGETNVVRAYRFLGQPFRLPLQLEAVEAYYDLDPLMVLTAAEDELRLDLRLQVRVFRGRVSSLSVLWPGWKSEGWQIESAEPKGQVVPGLPTDDVGGQGTISLNLADQLGESFVVQLRARRQLPRGGDEVRLALPHVRTPLPNPARLLLVSAENVEAELAPRGETVLRPYHGSSPVDVAPLGVPPEAQRAEYRIDTEERSFVLRVVPQAAQFRSQARVTATLENDRIAVQQEFQCAARYARVAELEVWAPVALGHEVEFSADGVALPAVWGAREAGRQRVRLPLPAPRLGEFSVLATWSVRLPREAGTADDKGLTLPVLQFAAGPHQQAELTFLPSTWFDVASTDARWRAERRSAGAQWWVSEPGADAFSFALQPTAGVAPGEFLGARAVIRAATDMQGTCQYQMQVRLTGAAGYFNVRLPAGAQQAEFAWDGQPLSQDQVREMPSGSQRYTLRLPAAPSAQDTHLLSIDYAVPAARPLSWRLEHLAFESPQLPQCKWVAQVVWVVTLPVGQHLFRYPASASPLFDWRREGLCWRRRSIWGDAQLNQWLGVEGDPAPSAVAAAGSVYCFGQFGPPQPLELQTMSVGLALGCGVGFSLIVGFLLIKFAAARSLLSLLLAGLAVVTASLYFLPQVELLLQPVAWGALLPLAAGAVGIWQRRRRAASVVTLAGASELRFSGLEPPAPGEQSLAAAADSGERLQSRLGGDSTAFRIPAESPAG